MVRPEFDQATKKWYVVKGVPKAQNLRPGDAVNLQERLLYLGHDDRWVNEATQGKPFDSEQSAARHIEQFTDPMNRPNPIAAPR